MTQIASERERERELEIKLLRKREIERDDEEEPRIVFSTPSILRNNCLDV